MDMKRLPYICNCIRSVEETGKTVYILMERNPDRENGFREQLTFKPPEPVVHRYSGAVKIVRQDLSGIHNSSVW